MKKKKQSVVFAVMLEVLSAVMFVSSVAQAVPALPSVQYRSTIEAEYAQPSGDPIVTATDLLGTTPMQFPVTPSAYVLYPEDYHDAGQYQKFSGGFSCIFVTPGSNPQPVNVTDFQITGITRQISFMPNNGSETVVSTYTYPAPSYYTAGSNNGAQLVCHKLTSGGGYQEVTFSNTLQPWSGTTVSEVHAISWVRQNLYFGGIANPLPAMDVGDSVIIRETINCQYTYDGTTWTRTLGSLAVESPTEMVIRCFYPVKDPTLTREDRDGWTDLVFVNQSGGAYTASNFASEYRLYYQSGSSWVESNSSAWWNIHGLTSGKYRIVKDLPGSGVLYSIRHRQMDITAPAYVDGWWPWSN